MTASAFVRDGRSGEYIAAGLLRCRFRVPFACLV
jgi:hypothetical protein